MALPLWKMANSLKKLKIHLPQNPLLGIYPEEMKNITA